MPRYPTNLSAKVDTVHEQVRKLLDIPNFDEPPGGDIAEAELTEEEKALKAKKDYEKILFASAD